MNYAQELKEQFGSIHPKLTDVAEYYLGLSPVVAKKHAAEGLIPFPIFKASRSNKSPWLVDVHDLAAYLRNQKEHRNY